MRAMAHNVIQLTVIVQVETTKPLFSRRKMNRYCNLQKITLSFWVKINYRDLSFQCLKAI